MRGADRHPARKLGGARRVARPPGTGDLQLVGSGQGHEAHAVGGRVRGAEVAEVHALDAGAVHPAGERRQPLAPVEVRVGEQREAAPGSARGGVEEGEEVRSRRRGLAGEERQRRGGEKPGAAGAGAGGERSRQPARQQVEERYQRQHVPVPDVQVRGHGGAEDDHRRYDRQGGVAERGPPAPDGGGAEERQRRRRERERRERRLHQQREREVARPAGEGDLAEQEAAPHLGHRAREGEAEEVALGREAVGGGRGDEALAETGRGGGGLGGERRGGGHGGAAGEPLGGELEDAHLLRPRADREARPGVGRGRVAPPVDRPEPAPCRERPQAQQHERHRRARPGGADRPALAAADAPGAAVRHSQDGEGEQRRGEEERRVLARDRGRGRERGAGRARHRQPAKAAAGAVERRHEPEREAEVGGGERAVREQVRIEGGAAGGEHAAGEAERPARPGADQQHQQRPERDAHRARARQQRHGGVVPVEEAVAEDPVRVDVAARGLERALGLRGDGRGQGRDRPAEELLQQRRVLGAEPVVAARDVGVAGRHVLGLVVGGGELAQRGAREPDEEQRRDQGGEQARRARREPGRRRLRGHEGPGGGRVASSRSR